MQKRLGGLSGIDVEGQTRQNYLKALANAAAKVIYKLVRKITFGVKPSLLKNATVAFFTISTTKQDGIKPTNDTISNIKKFIVDVKKINELYDGIIVSAEGFKKGNIEKQRYVISNAFKNSMLAQILTLRTLLTYGIDASDLDETIKTFFSKFDASMVPMFDKVNSLLYKTPQYKSFKDKIKKINDQYYLTFGPAVAVPE